MAKKTQQLPHIQKKQCLFSSQKKKKKVYSFDGCFREKKICSAIDHLLWSLIISTKVGPQVSVAVMMVDCKFGL